jgi:hypothetical protein
METEDRTKEKKRENRQLPKEILVQTTAGRLSLTIICTLLITFALNLAAAWYLARYSPNTGYLLIAAKWEMLRAMLIPEDILIFGDSAGNQGVDPEIIEEKLDLPGVNLCTIGDAMVVNDLWMLRDYLKQYRPPQAVLIVHGYDIWSRDVNIPVMSKIPGEWWKREPNIDLDLKQKIRIYLNRYVPLYTETRSLANRLQNPWNALDKGLNLDENGFMAQAELDLDRLIKDTDAHLKFVQKKRLVLSALNRKALEQIRDLADEKQFDVFIINGPVYEVLYSDDAFQNYFYEVQKVISDIAAGSDRMHYILNPPMTFPRDKMQSADHTTNAGAREYTIRIIDELTPVLSGPEPDSLQ